MANEVIRQKAKESGVFMWEIADAMAIHDSALSRLLRHELSNRETERILSIIEVIHKIREVNKQ